jgi:thiol-disulfide isomerase/thioredoxin
MPSPLDSSLPLPEGEARNFPPLPEGEAESAAPAGGSSWPLAILLLLAAVTLLVIQLRRPRPADPLVGRPLPPLDAAGWLNTENPLTAADLRGKIVAIDFWASWCPECLLDMPKLAEFYQRFRDRGVVLIGLSDEPAADASRIESIVRNNDRVDWPIAYGAWMAFQITGVEGRPQYVLYDAHGVSVWSGVTVDELESAVVELLARSNSK